MRSPRIIWLDMDDTLADFKEDPVFDRGFDVSLMYEPGFFRNLKPIAGAQVAVRQLLALGYDLHVLTQPVAHSAHSYSEKTEWIGMHFPELISKITMTQDKGLMYGDYLIDDNLEKWGTRFKGQFVHFDYSKDHSEEWARIVDKFKKEIA